MIKIRNDGAEIVETDYWDTPHAAAGYCYLSANAGAYRLLVPDALAGEALDEMRTGTRGTIERTIRAGLPDGCWDVVFEDGTASPFSLTLTGHMIDRPPKPGRCRLSVWTRQGKQLDLPCRIR